MKTTRPVYPRVRTHVIAALALLVCFLAPRPISGQWFGKKESAEPALLGVSAQGSTTERASLLELARAQLGRRYLFGGEQPEEGFDCSGLMRYLMRTLGVSLPRTSAQQAQAGEAVPTEVASLRVGDLLTFGKGGRVSHIGVYVGDGRYVHASSGSGRVVEARLGRTLGLLQWLGARRVLATRGDTLRPVLAN